MKAPTKPARTHSWVCETWISQIFYVSVIMLLRFSRIIIRPSALFICENLNAILKNNNLFIRENP